MSHGITPSRPVAPATSAPSAPTRSKAKSKAKTPFKTPFKTPLRSATKRPIPPPQEALPTPSGVDLAAPMRRRTSKSKPKPVGIHSPFRSPLVTRTTSTSLAPPSSFKSKSKSTSDRSSENELISSNHDATTNHSLHLQALHSLATPSRTPRRSPSGAPASASRHYHTPLCTQSDTLLRLLRAKSAVVRAQTADLVGRNQELQTFISHRDSSSPLSKISPPSGNPTRPWSRKLSSLASENEMPWICCATNSASESPSFYRERSAVESLANRAP
ncbi:hypothetical protein BCR44DRAFT_1502988 [Catenaria anguillulae PL171]|uniref:Uncharacterized protein n=1 Tax=Catenaria anguillulae PL171 TaxID=765915 RepID=A0A1Y2HB60_9FUNG|nr:hypothetical protein BCR44DRAFT_1502988 [Catenaria anguillulae PL171]